jgi:hypothetical protein
MGAEGAMPGSIAAGASDGGSATSGQPVGGGAAVNEPVGGTPSDAIALTPESLIRVPGQDQPVKYSDFIGGYVPKADFTRAQQRVAAERDALQRQMQEQEQRFATAARALLARLQGGGTAAGAPGAPGGAGGNALDAMLAGLESQPYVDGATAANLLRNLVQQNVLPLATALKQRDQALKLLFERLQAIDGTVGQLRNQTTNEEFQAKLAKARSDLRLPDDPVVNELLQDVYLSHEGEDLDQEFPNMVKARFEGLRKLIRDLDKREAEEARAARIGIPGKGGQAVPGRPLRRGFLSAAEIADQMWPGGGANET